MSTTMTPVNGALLSEEQVLTATMRLVGDLHAAGDREQFRDVLTKWGMDRREADAYWGHLLPSAGDPAAAKDNTQMARALGIEVDNGPTPFVRCQLLYRMVELHAPDLLTMTVTQEGRFRRRSVATNPPMKRLDFPRRPTDAQGRNLSVLRLLRGERPAQFLQMVVQRAQPLTRALGEDLGLRLAHLLLEQKMLIPDAAVLERLAPVLLRGTRGATVTLTGVFCPDYAYEATGNPGIPYRYTFDGVGDGVGLVAQQFVRVIPPLSRFLTEAGIAHRIVLGIGDFEAEAQSVLDRVGVDRAEFLTRCRRSLEAFAAAVPDTEVELEMFAEAHGQARMDAYGAEALRRMLEGDFGRMRELHPELDRIIGMIGQQYRAFYGRWHGKEFSEQETLEMVLRQGGEYAACACICAEDFGENAIIIAGDRPQMHTFNAFYETLPTLCVKRAY